MIKGLCKEGLLDDAEDLLMMMEENDYSPDGCTHNVFVQGLLQRYDISRSTKYLQIMKGKGLSADVPPQDGLSDILLLKKKIMHYKSSCRSLFEYIQWYAYLSTNIFLRANLLANSGSVLQLFCH